MRRDSGLPTLSTFFRFLPIGVRRFVSLVALPRPTIFGVPTSLLGSNETGVRPYTVMGCKCCG